MKRSSALAAWGGRVWLALLVGTDPATATTTSARLSINPLRKVVTMLKMMQNKVEADGKKGEEDFHKFMCWCETASDGLAKSIAEAETKIPQVESGVEETSSFIAQLKAEIEQAKKDRAEAIAAVKKATAIHKKETADNAKAVAEDKANILALEKAIKALEAGMAGSFLQTQAAVSVRDLSVSLELSDSDRDVLSAFLAEGEDAGDENGYAPQSGEIVGILKQMKDTIEKELRDEIAKYGGAKADFEEMSKAKAKEIEALTLSIEEKMARLGKEEVALVNLKEDLEDTKASLDKDKGFLADLQKSCERTKRDWAEQCETRREELLALAETIKVLNDDDTLDLFKKTISTSSFLQLGVSSKEVKLDAFKVLRGHPQKDRRVALIQLALRSGKVSFEKVLKMIDDMFGILAKEQGLDDDKKKYCEAELDKVEDETKELKHSISDLEKAIEDDKEMAAKLAGEIVALTEAIKELDKEVAEATAQRKTEHEDFTEFKAANLASKDILKIAKNRLNKFYNPKLYKAPVRELSEEDRITQNMGGTLAPTPLPGGIAGTGVTALAQVMDTYARGGDVRAAEDRTPAGEEEAVAVPEEGASFAQVSARVAVSARSEEQDGLEETIRTQEDTEAAQAMAQAKSMVEPPPPPSGPGAYSKKGEESGGVMAMMGALEADLDKQIQEAEVSESNAQEEYEEFVQDSAEERAASAKSIEQKEGAKAGVIAEIDALTKEHKADSGELREKEAYTMGLHAECDFLLKSYKERRAARSTERDTLLKTKAVLSGSDYSFLQVAATRRLRVARYW